jgi:hypothetical protein
MFLAPVGYGGGNSFASALTGSGGNDNLDGQYCQTAAKRRGGAFFAQEAISLLSKSMPA